MIRGSVGLVVFCFAAQGCAQPSGREGLDVQRDEPRAVGSDGGEEATAAGDQGNVGLPRFPSISPDGETVVFSWRGDLWKVSATGGHATRLTSHPGDDLRSGWSRDGTRIAFDSTRDGFRNVYLMNADGTDVRQLTRMDQRCNLAGFGVDADGHEVVTFSSAFEGDLHRSARPFYVSVAGGDLIRLHDAFGSYPQVSPSGTRVAFTRGGSRWSRRHYRGPDARDVWIHMRTDGTFKRLTNWPGNDGRAVWAGDDALLFLSDRKDSCVNLYRMDVATGGEKAERLTYFKDNDVQYVDVSADGQTAVIAVWDTLYRLDLSKPNAEPVPLVLTGNEDDADNFELKPIDREVSEAALSPDGQVMAYVAYGEVYVRNIDEKSPTRRVTNSHAREKDIAWSPDGLKLYFVSDRSGTDSIYAATVALTRKEVKEAFDEAVNPPADEDKAAPGADDQDKAEQPGPEQGRADEDADESDVDEEKKRKERDEKEEEKLPKMLRPKRWHDALKFTISDVVVTDTNDRAPSPSPDGKLLAFRRGLGDLTILDVDTGDTRTLAEGWDPGLAWRWSPDSRHIAYQQSDMNFNTDIWIVPADASAPAVNVTRHPDDDVSPRWSADGKILAFLSERVNEEFDVWMVYLDKEMEVYTPHELDNYYEQAAKAAKKRKPLKIEPPKKEEDQPGKGKSEEEQGERQQEAAGEDDKASEEKVDKNRKPLDLDDAYLRLRRVTDLHGSEDNLELTPAGDRYIFNASLGERALYSLKWDGKDRKRLMDAASVQQVSLTGDKVVVVAKNRAGTVGPSEGDVEWLDIADKMRIDLAKQSSQKFYESARILGERFYHPTMKGRDWPALTEKYHVLALATRTDDEFDYVAARLLGELNASHLGVYSREEEPPNAQRLGRLGTIHRRVDDGFEVLLVIPESPAAKGPMALQPGDIITAIELQPFGPTDTVESLLAGRVDEETLVSLRRTKDDGEVVELRALFTPVSWREQRQLKYKALRRNRAARVAQLSDGRIGYIHIRAMNQRSLDVFERDLYAAAGDKDGLIIDVRDNGGGWTTDRLLSSIMVQEHAYTIPRGADPGNTGHYPQGRLFIQRYTLPINMLCNEKSFSNAEIISHAFKTLQRGTLVGQETYGAVISTGGTRLIDGTWVRIPFRGWYLLDGTDMENHGAVPDIIVPQTPEAETRNEDEQLEAAVADLLKRL